MSTLPDREATDQLQPESPETDARLPEFLLSAVRPCRVELIVDPDRQTAPSRSRAELLADGQCEV